MMVYREESRGFDTPVLRALTRVFECEHATETMLARSIGRVSSTVSVSGF